MKILAYVILLAATAGGCNAQSNPDSANAASAEADDSEAQTNKDPRWMIAIEGMPEMSGNVISAATMGASGSYAMARSGFTASIRLLEDDPTSYVMIKFSEENVRCMNKDGATTVREDDRAIIAGEVLCFPADGSSDDAKPAAIEGYFEVEQ